jgi:hypothetical protein
MRHAIYILPTLLTVTTADAQAFVGRWYSDSSMECKGEKGSRVTPLVYTAKGVFGMEPPLPDRQLDAKRDRHRIDPSLPG